MSESIKIIKQQAMTSFKWTSLTTLVLRLLVPINYMILARLLTPQSFGIAATTTIIISFAEIITDAGLPLYLIQHEFTDEVGLQDARSLAFWVNGLVGLFLMIVLILNRNFIAHLLGIDGLGMLVAIAALQLPFNAILSVYLAMFRRQFVYKTIFAIRATASLIPVVVSVSLAFLGMRYWSFVIGMVSGQVMAAGLAFLLADFRPSWHMSFTDWQPLIHYGGWSILESFAIWFCGWMDTLLIGALFSVAYLGLYKTSLSLVNSLVAIITGSITPVLFSALTRLQSNVPAITTTYQKTQKVLAYFVFPLGMGLFLYRDLAIKILLGSQWQQAGFIVGIWGLTSMIKIVFSDLSNECVRAMGKPNITFWIHIRYVILLAISILISYSYGFEILVLVRALMRFTLVFSSIRVMKKMFHISAYAMLKNVLRPLLFTVLMGCLALLLMNMNSSMGWQFFSILLCAVFYGFLIVLFANNDAKWLFAKGLAILK